MCIVDQTLRQLIRSRVHEITDLAAEISDRTRYAVDVEQSGDGGSITITIYDPSEVGGEIDKRQFMGGMLPGTSASHQDCTAILENLEDFAQQLRAIRHGGQS